MALAKAITLEEFNDTLDRYPDVIQKFADAEKPAPVTLEQLDHFRYIDAPAAFSRQTGRHLAAADIQQLTAWKLRHGKYRPTLTKLVASNTDETVKSATKEAFDHHSSNPEDLTGTLKLLSAPLKGVGPATASLILSVHDPENVIFFSDEAYCWLVAGGKKSSLKYDLKEYDALNTAKEDLQDRLDGITPIEIEKVAFVILKENEPVKDQTTSAAYVPTGRPRGRPPKPESEKKAPKPPAVPGRGRGRPPGKKSVAAPAKKAVKKTSKKDESAGEAETPATGKKRGRPGKSADEDEPTTPVAGRKRGRLSKTDDDAAPKGKKAKA